MKRIAALTMVRNDDFFLQKWISYYGKELGMENLYVYVDGEDGSRFQQVSAGYERFQEVHIEVHTKIGTSVISAEKGRLKFLSERAAELLKTYDLVIGTDADEYLYVDPRLGKSLKDFLSEQKICTSLSALGLDFGQKLSDEGPLTLDKPFLQQRHYAQIGTRYTKPSVLAKSCQWGSGFHRVKGHNFHIAKGLYLLHFGYADKDIIAGRLADKDRAAQGWEKHIQKRSRTISLVNKLKARDFDRWTQIARFLQSVCRPPWAWNKPGMLEMKIIVAFPPALSRPLR